MEPLVSVIIITHNNEKYIKKAIDSVLHQSFEKEFEIIVINDDSDDNTESIVLSMEKQFDNIVYQKVYHHCAAKARFEGVKIARGQYICFLDGDDYYHKDMLKIMYKTITDQSADIVNCSLYYVRKNKIEKNYWHKNIVLNNKYESLAALFKDTFLHGFMPTKIYKASLLKQMLGKVIMPTTNFVYEDVLINYFIFKHAEKVVCIKDRFFYYNKANEKSITNSKKRVQDNLNISALIRKNIDDSKDEKLRKIFLKYYWRRWSLIFTDLYLSSFDDKKEKKKIKKQSYKDLKEIYTKNKAMKIDDMSYENFINSFQIKV